MRIDNWRAMLEKYRLIKGLYIECEETDPELKTNLQPLNEFRLALDHVFRLIDIELATESGDLSHSAHFQDEDLRLNGHLVRAFFDVCDMLAINYRNKIVSALEIYSPDSISLAYPRYYSEIKPAIEQISQRIAVYRGQKGGDAADAYYRDVMALRDIFKHIIAITPSLDELRREEVRQKGAESRNRRLGWLIAIVGIVLGAVIALLK
ncbi:hypothetical protein FACS1894139_15800 [Planctomycetales bacterium]|nr:hypothetical protein FACS1894107_13170 [Planctomycetales bacterium]GHT07457.1 hypothetical protein FACS1894139_15800 [Planctomycetales bacterium]GHV23773.1 hypothetical protein AGMMS49959_17990 [Planctomycetales bacterium]